MMRSVKRKVHDDDIQNIRDTEDGLAATLNLSSAGKRLVKLFHTNNPEESKELHQILNDPDRYVIVLREQTWEKDKGITLGMCVFLEYSDLYPEEDPVIQEEKPKKGKKKKTTPEPEPNDFELDIE